MENSFEYFRSGNTLIVKLEETTFQKTFTSGEKVESILDTLNDMEDLTLAKVAELFNYSSDSKISEFIKESSRIKDQMDIIELMKDIRDNGHEYLEVDGLKVYAKGIRVAMPETIVKEFMLRKDNETDLKALANFWSLCCLNPDVRTRENLFEFCDVHGIKLTDKGYLIVYRNADVKNSMADDQNLHDFIYASLIDWKAKDIQLDDLSIFKDDDGKFSVRSEKSDYFEGDGGAFVGNVGELLNIFESKSGKTIFTDQYSRTTTIEIGKPVSLPEASIDSNPERECSRGLHVAGSKWLRQNYFGDQGLVCLVNPMKVRAVPYADRGKMRVAEYMAIGLAKYDEDGNIIEVPTKTFEYDYQTITAAEIADLLHTTDLEESKKSFTIPTEVNKDTLATVFKNVVEIDPEDLEGQTEGRVVKASAKD